MSSHYQNRRPGWLTPTRDYTAVHDALLDALPRVPDHAGRHILWALWRLAYRMDRPIFRQLVKLDHEHRALITISGNHLAELAGVGLRSVRRGVTYLHSSGLAEVATGKGGRPNIYVLGPEHMARLEYFAKFDRQQDVSLALATEREAECQVDTEPRTERRTDTGHSANVTLSKSREPRPGQHEPTSPIRPRVTLRGEASHSTEYSVTNAGDPESQLASIPDWPMSPRARSTKVIELDENGYPTEASLPC